MSDKRQLIDAIKAGDAAAAKALVLAHPELAGASDENGVSLVLLGLYYQQPDIAHLLRQRKDGADAFEAAALGEVDVLRDMFGSDPDFPAAHAADGFTPLHLAAFFRQPVAARFLLAHGADPDAVTNTPSALRPLHSACAARHAGLVRILLAAGADPDCQQHGGHTPLHAAALHGDAAIIRVLICNGADPAIRNDDGKSPAEMLPEEHLHLRDLFDRRT